MGQLRPWPLLPSALLLTLAVAAPVSAVNNDDLRFDTTEDLIAVCAAPESSPAQLACTGFIEATVQYHDAVADRENLKRLICYPAGTSIGDGRQALLSWAKTHRADAKLMAEQPVVGLVRALAAAYPCR